MRDRNRRSVPWPRCPGSSGGSPVTRCSILLLTSFLACGVFLTIGTTAAQEVPELRINSKRYIVLDADTGEIFAQRDARESVAMASLTKIFTAVEAIEAAPGDVAITTTPSDLVSEQASSMGFGPDETFTLQELLLGMMLPSGNDAARAIARALGAQPGDDDAQALERFVARINQRVRDMGLKDTTLVNPDGWGVPGHHSSAHDLAVFTMYALRYPRFVDLISTYEYETAAGYRLRNNNRLLTGYDDLLGGKTGYDNDAGWCLVEVARRDGSTMISVTLDGVAPDDWYDDNRVLLEYAFEQKAARAAAGGDIVGERVGYLDPDAAVVARNAAAGASLGAPVPIAQVDAAPGAGEPGGGTIVPAAVNDDDDRTGSRRQILAAIGVAAAVILGGGLRAFRQTARTAPATAIAGPPKRNRGETARRGTAARIGKGDAANAPPLDDTPVAPPGSPYLRG